jgi:hypothetical protein
MFRGRLVIFFALAAVALAVLGIFSYFAPLPLSLFTSEREALWLHFYDGRARMFWFHAPDDLIRVDGVEMQPILRVRMAGNQELAEGRIGPPAAVFLEVGTVRIGSRREVSWFGGAWRRSMIPRTPAAGRAAVESSFIRFPIWPLVVLLIIPPLQESFAQRRRWRRRARNECAACGYSLTGLVEPRCPECATPTC